MRILRFLLISLCILPVATAGEILTLKGEAIKGDIVRVSDTEVVFNQGGTKKTLPMKEVLKIDFREPSKATIEKYSRVELHDGTVLLVTEWKIRKREITLNLLSGPIVTLPLTAVANLLNRAEDEKHRTDWKSRTINLRGREGFVVKKDTVISTILATLGEGDDEGKIISAAITLDGETTTLKRSQTTIHGLIFKPNRDPNVKPELCRLFDTMGNVVMVSEIVPKEGGVEITTPGGVKFGFAYEQLSRLDYQKGKLDYLSSLDPSKVLAKSNLDEDTKPDQWHIYKDTNLNKGPLTLGGVVYTSGLALKPYCELTYDLKGDYREFTALVGLDDNVSASGKTILIVEGDDKVLGTVEISADDKKRFKPLTLNVKDVQRLKITVKADGEFDIARHLDLADAKVSK
ncbi:MAG: hypothetical protein EBV06_05640 [Planctomycetia bacterium]|nr:hypothetical protein [Planctomycetia bacterium]